MVSAKAGAPSAAIVVKLTTLDVVALVDVWLCVILDDMLAVLEFDWENAAGDTRRRAAVAHRLL